MNSFRFSFSLTFTAGLALALPLAAQHDHDHPHPHPHEDTAHAHPAPTADHDHPHEDGHDHPHADDLRGTSEDAEHDHPHPHGDEGAVAAHEDHGHAREANADDRGHAHGPGGHDDHGDHGDDHGHEHGADEGPVVSVTHYTEDSELFMEPPPLVRGEPARLIVHLTRLSDFSPITRGSLEVRLTPQSGQPYAVTVSQPARDGIFLPTITPPFTGPATMELILRGPQLDDTHRLEDVVVYRSTAEIPAAEEEAESPDAISFLKEQQWRILFATVPAESRTVNPSVRAFGTLQIPAAGQAIIPAPADGIVRFEGNGGLLEAGAEVTRGTALFSIEPDASWSAGLAGLREDYLLARLELQRLQRLFEEEAVAEKRVEAARIRLQTLESAINRLGGENASEDMEHFQAIAAAPFAGVLSEIRVRPGQRIMAGDPLAIIVDDSRLLLKAAVPTPRLYGFPPVTDAVFEVLGGAERYRISHLGGKPVSSGPVSGQQEGLAQLRFLFDNPEKRLIPGSRATVHLIAEDTANAGPAIPVEALNEEQGAPLVYVLTAGETVEKRYPRLGASDGQFVRVLADIEPGERVVTRGATAIRLSSLSRNEMGHGHAH